MASRLRIHRSPTSFRPCKHHTIVPTSADRIGRCLDCAALVPVLFFRASMKGAA